MEMAGLTKLRVGFLASTSGTRAPLHASNQALRHQQRVRQGGVKRPKAQRTDRVLWSLLAKAWKWRKDAHAFAEPNTLIHRQRGRFKEQGRGLSRSGQPGRPLRTVVGLAMLVFVARAPAAGQMGALMVEGPERSINGFSSYKLNSPYQGRTTCVEVLTPDEIDATMRYPVLYLLPVNDGVVGQWGNGLVEAKHHDIANRFSLICVSPEYDYTPWYGDHPTERALAQESYLIKAVIPMIEARFPVLDGPQGRILLGFSKSGFGAVSITLRHLDIIGKAVAWDAPLTMKSYFPNEEEMVRVFQTQENFDNYRIPTLIERQHEILQNASPRLFLLSNANPTDSIAALHELLKKKGIPHRYAVDAKREHTWTSGWLPVAVNLLFSGDAPERE